jgi:flagellar basal-body rod protein FlgG
MKVLGIAATGMAAQQLNVEVIANNIANMSTTGFKRARAEFQDLIYQSQRRQGAMSSDAGTIVPAGVELGLGVKPAAVTRINTQGTLTLTNNKLDVALEGRGYLVVTLPDGTEAYTRAGNLQKSAEGQVVTVDGYEISPGIVIPDNARDIVINRSGEVMAYIDGQTDPQTLGQLELANFVNEAGLEALGDNLFRETPASGQPQRGVPGTDGFATLRQGYVEASNVNVVDEMTALITAQRAYEMNSKVVQAADQMSQTATNMR